MTNLPETSNFDAGVYEIQTTDPVIGGPSGISNAAAQNLANRTRWLYNTVQSILVSLASFAGLNSPAFTGSPTTTLAGAADNSGSIANTAWVNRANAGVATVNVAAGGTITLTAAQYGFGIIELVGTLAANATVVVPATGKWIIGNYTSGSFTCAIKGAGLSTSVFVAQGTAEQIFTDGASTLYTYSGRIRIIGGTLNLYVAPTGSDSNPGTAASSPFLTINGALAAVAANYDLSGAAVQINLAAGTYAGCSIDGNQISVPVNIVGNISSPATVIVNGVNGAAISSLRSASVTVFGLTVTSSGASSDYVTGGIGLSATSTANIVIGSGIVFGTCAVAHIFASQSGYISPNAVGISYTVTGGAQYHWLANTGGIISWADNFVVLTGTPAFSQYFALAAASAVLNVWNITFTGGATGARYYAIAYGQIGVRGASATYLPGNAAGSVSNGLYA